MNSLNQAYYRAYKSVIMAPPNNGNFSRCLANYQGAECLYLIVTLGVVDDLGGRELFNESNIGDVDGDGFKEFLDGWGIPFVFSGVPAGFSSELNTVATGRVEYILDSNFFTKRILLDPLANDSAYNRYSRSYSLRVL